MCKVFALTSNTNLRKIVIIFVNLHKLVGTTQIVLLKIKNVYSNSGGTRDFRNFL
jgi:hypothetical protein